MAATKNERCLHGFVVLHFPLRPTGPNEQQQTQLRRTASSLFQHRAYCGPRLPQKLLKYCFNWNERRYGQCFLRELNSSQATGNSFHRSHLKSPRFDKLVLSQCNSTIQIFWYFYESKKKSIKQFYWVQILPIYNPYRNIAKILFMGTSKMNRIRLKSSESY